MGNDTDDVIEIPAPAVVIRAPKIEYRRSTDVGGWHGKFFIQFQDD